MMENIEFGGGGFYVPETGYFRGAVLVMDEQKKCDLFLGKHDPSFGEPSFLSLVNISVGEVVVPAGSLWKVDWLEYR